MNFYEPVLDRVTRTIIPGDVRSEMYWLYLLCIRRTGYRPKGQYNLEEDSAASADLVSLPLNGSVTFVL